ncbi:thioesterase-like superfamily-domain-containing protein [Xylaria nigripes]|nr:thioesterase-like superfamily-domain-containing protein [Xylaria nigripes]
MMRPRPSAEAIRKGHGRLTFQEALGLTALPDRISDDGQVVKRFISRRRAWVPGEDFTPLSLELGRPESTLNRFAFGGHVYSQSGIAASLTAREIAGRDSKIGIHTMHGYFSEAGLANRPFIYEVTVLSSHPSFTNILVSARQPTSPRNSDDYFPQSDADQPLGPVCFSAILSFRPISPSPLGLQEPPAQERFADILSSRRPTDWDPAPIADIDGPLDAIPGSRKAVSLFPILDMRKVDMRAYNATRPFHERRELILYRLLAPLPDADDEIGGYNAHICAHAYGADRNGLLMVGQHAGSSSEVVRAASLSYSFVVHVSAEDAVMEFSEGGGGGGSGSGSGGKEQWWIQEVCFPRLQAGRGIVHTKIWSPAGVHVATEFQDGLIKWQPRQEGEQLGKL